MRLASGDTCRVTCEWADEVKTRRVKIIWDRGDGFYEVEWLGRTKFLDTKPEKKFGTLFEPCDLELIR